jgi:hypothetical protein
MLKEVVMTTDTRRMPWQCNGKLAYAQLWHLAFAVRTVVQANVNAPVC